VLLCFVRLFANAQAPAKQVTLSGTVSDPSGAIIPNANIHVENAKLHRDAVSDAAGHFSLSLPAGTYSITILAPSFAAFIATRTLRSSTSLDAKLAIATAADAVIVNSEAASTAAADNKSALTFKNSDLQTFSSDDGTFQQQIEALAGAGGDSQSGPSIYVNGFSNGRFPPKNSIREIRINQNPYSAQYDELGYGRIEILTKPGSDTLHGFFAVEGNDNALNTANPYATTPPPYHSLDFEGNLSGPINKQTSFFLNGSYNDQQNNAVVDATTLDTSNNPASFQQAVSNPTTTNNYAARIDRQIGANNTFIARYEFNRVQQTNGGVGLLVLPSQGLNSTTTAQTLQLSNTQLIGTKMVSESHFQYQRTRTEQNSVSSAPTLSVEGAFNGGGNSTQTSSDNQDRYEFQEFFTREQKAHFLRFGARYRLLRDANLSTPSYNGGFTFPNITAYQITEQGLAANETDAQIRATCVTTPTGQVCGGATQFNLTAGQPSAVVLTGDLGLFAEDEWKLSKTFTLDYGMRFETQSGIPDHFDPAPRAGFAWAIGQDKKKQPIVTIRGGTGLFYDRFASSNILTSIRENGVLQPSYVVTNPTFFPNVPLASTLTAAPPTTYQISPDLRSEYEVLAGVEAERNLGGKGSISVTYLHYHGVHEWNSANINAPLPGTFVYNPNGNSTGIFPYGTSQPIYQFQSHGTTNVERLRIRMNLNPTKNIFLFLFYGVRGLSTDSSEGSTATLFPSNSYDITLDYGRNAHPAQRLFLGNFYQIPKGFTVGAFFSAASPAPFNITTGTDLNGDSQYNDRPTYATAASPAAYVVKTRFGTFDTLPQPGEKIIPIDLGNGPGFADLDLTLRKAFKFGPRVAPPAPEPGSPAPTGPAEKPDPRYMLAFSIDAENVLNHVNPGAPVGVLSSPQFGQSISLNSPYSGNSSATRTVQLHVGFEF
jgi:hypothetical protein